MEQVGQPLKLINNNKNLLSAKHSPSLDLYSAQGRVHGAVMRRHHKDHNHHTLTDFRLRSPCWNSMKYTYILYVLVWLDSSTTHRLPDCKDFSLYSNILHLRTCKAPLIGWTVQKRFQWARPVKRNRFWERGRKNRDCLIDMKSNRMRNQFGTIICHQTTICTITLKVKGSTSIGTKVTEVIPDRLWF